MGGARLKPLHWIASTRSDLRQFPEEVRAHLGYALYLAQAGRKHLDAKPLRGLGSGVLEVVANHDGSTFRAVYTVRYRQAVYVLHAFQKKSRRGIATPKKELELIRQRLKAAEEHHKRTYGKGQQGGTES